MKSNYRKIGDFIQLVDERNTDLDINLLLGLSINKVFIPSVANIVGTNMANYKIIKKNQFSCSLMQVRRDKKIPVALLKDYDEAIISQAYPVFKISDTEELLPDYLMMWMSRSEFDREACFNAVGGVRGSLEWEDFCNMELPVPSPEKQQEIVDEYNIVVNRIKLNEDLNQKLEEAAQTLYRHWFVDFEFPISVEYAEANGKPELEGQPYKSSGGKFTFNEELEREIPENWSLIKVSDFTTEMKNGGTPNRSVASYWNASDIPWLKSGEVINSGIIIETEEFISESGYKSSSAKLLPVDSVLIALYGATAGQVGFLKFECTTNQAVCAMICENKTKAAYLYYYLLLNQDVIKNMANGGAQANISKNIVEDLPLIKPDGGKWEYKYWERIINSREVYSRQIKNLKRLTDLILKKMSTVKVEEYEIH